MPAKKKKKKALKAHAADASGSRLFTDSANTPEREKKLVEYSDAMVAWKKWSDPLQFPTGQRCSVCQTDLKDQKDVIRHDLYIECVKCKHFVARAELPDDVVWHMLNNPDPRSSVCLRQSQILRVVCKYGSTDQILATSRLVSEVDKQAEK